MSARRISIVAAAVVLAIALVGAPARARLDACGALQPIAASDGSISCTHGPDPAPPGIDASVPRPLASSTPTGDLSTTSASSAAVPCYGDGTSGKRVQALYVRPSDRPDRSAQVVPLIRQWAAETDDVFARSAAAVGAVRHIRFVTTADCALDVQQATISSSSDDTLGATIIALANQGYDRPDRRYLVWMDSTVLCGIANYYLDERAGLDNANNGNGPQPGAVARIDAGCWGLAARGESVEAHELLHTLGGVEPTAPHATPLGHCTDESDRMCYDDGSPGFVAHQTCPLADEALFDCNHDDYFNPSPPPSSYLATHWDTARSDFLAGAAPAPTSSTTVTRVAGTDRIATTVAASRDAFPSSQSAGSAVVANATSFADALTGVPLAAKKGGPLLLTTGDSIDPRVLDELSRVLRPGTTVFLLGGQAALSDAVADAVTGAGFGVVRYGGGDRFATARIIAEDGLGGPGTVLEATGQSFPDALTAGAAAAAAGGAVLLTNGDTQSTETLTYLASHPAARRFALGGPASRADPTAQAVAGDDRYGTARLVAEAFFTAPTVVGIANGLLFPDALSGGANVAARSGPMLLTTPDSPLPNSLVAYLEEQRSVQRAYLYGGDAALSPNVATGVARLTE